jgi:four helix bundle protein
MFDHEKFEAYQLSIRYWESILAILDHISFGSGIIKDQLRRAASSISLNIAEGCGRVKIDDRKRFYVIARGSALECAAISDLLIRSQPELIAALFETKQILRSIVNILSSIVLK